MYRIITNDSKIIPFDSYYEALKYQMENGGILYVKVYGN